MNNNDIENKQTEGTTSSVVSEKQTSEQPKENNSTVESLETSPQEEERDKQENEAEQKIVEPVIAQDLDNKEENKIINQTDEKKEVNNSNNPDKNNIHNNNNWISKIIDYCIEKSILSKIFIICFATLVFSYVYSHQQDIQKDALAYIGLILCVIVCYTEILGIRDHLWLIEGSIPVSKRWREAFFSPSTLRKHKVKKMIVLLFAFIVFVGIYRIKAFSNSKGALSFLGIILMVTVVYYEILAIRDEIDTISKSVKQYLSEKKSDNEQNDKNEII